MLPDYKAFLRIWGGTLAFLNASYGFPAIAASAAPGCQSMGHYLRILCKKLSCRPPTRKPQFVRQ
jgi:hypothetical protein